MPPEAPSAFPCCCPFWEPPKLRALWMVGKPCPQLRRGGNAPDSMRDHRICQRPTRAGGAELQDDPLALLAASRMATPHPRALATDRGTSKPCPLLCTCMRQPQLVSPPGPRWARLEDREPLCSLHRPGIWNRRELLLEFLRVSTTHGWGRMFSQGTPLAYLPRDTPTLLGPLQLRDVVGMPGLRVWVPWSWPGHTSWVVGAGGGQWCLSQGPLWVMEQSHQGLGGSNVLLGLLPRAPRLLRRQWAASLAGLAGCLQGRRGT